jgi:DnaJ-class molecular chaperone
MSLYDDLGVPRDATTEQIIAAFRAKAKAHHPDAGGDPEDFAKVQRAAEVLRDPVTRARYDETGSADNGPDNDQARAASLLCDVFRQVRQRFSDRFDRIDLAGELRRGIDQLHEGLAKDRARLTNDRDLNGHARLRLRHSGKGADFLRSMLEDEAAKITRLLAELDHRQRIIDLASKMAREYDWVVNLDDLEIVLLMDGGTNTMA